MFDISRGSEREKNESQASWQHNAVFALYNYRPILKHVNATSRYRVAMNAALGRLQEYACTTFYIRTRAKLIRLAQLNSKRYLIFNSLLWINRIAEIAHVIPYSIRQIYSVIRTLIRADYVVPRRYFEFLSAFLRGFLSSLNPKLQNRPTSTESIHPTVFNCLSNQESDLCTTVLFIIMYCLSLSFSLLLFLLMMDGM